MSAESTVKGVHLSEAKDVEEKTIEKPPLGQYRIGTFGTPWGDEEKAAWLAQTTATRSYKEEVRQQQR